MKTKPIHSLLSALILFSGVQSMAQESKSAPSENRSLAEMAEERRTRPLSEFSPDELQLFVYERELLRRYSDGHLEEAMDLFIAEDAIASPPDSETIRGRDTQKELFKAWLGTEGVLLDWEPIDAFVGPSGDMGYVEGLVRWKDPEGPQHLGKYISVWVKQDGKWLNKVEIRNSTRIEKQG